MKILERLPIYDEPTVIDVQGEVYQVWKNQAIIWVSLDETLIIANKLRLVIDGERRQVSLKTSGWF